MRAWPAQYEKPVTAALPQNAKSAACGSPIGQWHLSCAISSSEQRCALSIGADAAAASWAALGACAPIKRNSRLGGELRGCPTRGGQERAGAPAGRAGDKPRRWILPMTALRVTPISAAI